jgi:hypothetical protein
MNPVIEEALTNMIKRIDKLERTIETFQNNPPEAIRKPIQRQRTGLASQSQMDYAQSLGGQVWDGMTSKEAGEQIDTLKEAKKQYRSQQNDSKIITREDADHFADYEMSQKSFTEEQRAEFPDY